MINQLSIALLSQTSLELEGSLLFKATPLAFELPRLHFYTTSGNIQHLLSPQEGMEQIALPDYLSLSAQAQGTAEDVAFQCGIQTPSGDLQARGSTLLSPDIRFKVSADLDSLLVDRLILDLPVSIPSVSAHARAEGEIQEEGLHSLVSDLTLQHLIVKK